MVGGDYPLLWPYYSVQFLQFAQIEGMFVDTLSCLEDTQDPNNWQSQDP